MVCLCGPRDGDEARTLYIFRNFRSCRGESPMKPRTSRIQLLVWILSLGVVACLVPYHAKTSAAQKGPTSSYYTHGRIYTNDPEHPWAEAMAVSEGRITCIGKMDHLLTDCGGGQEGVHTPNPKAPFVMPPLNAPHVHLG